MNGVNRHLWLSLALVTAAVSGGCLGSSNNNGATTAASANRSTGTTTTTTTSSTINSGPAAVQIVLATGASGSFSAGSVPSSGGTYVTATKVYDLNGNLITSPATTYPYWWFEGAGVFLTSTSTSYAGGGAGATTSDTDDYQITPCAYFDSATDNNPESAGYYTIDGILTNPSSLANPSGTNSADIDQCAGITAGERAKLGFYVKLRRSTSTSMGTSDKIQMIIKARPLTAPNTAPVPSSCIVGGFFDATACATAVFTLTMRTGLAAAAKPFYMLMPSAKSLDLVSESVILPVNIDTTLTHITVDRLKGGAVFYSIILVKVP